jgi:hypothetical protein
MHAFGFYRALIVLWLWSHEYTRLPDSPWDDHVTPADRITGNRRRLYVPLLAMT